MSTALSGGKFGHGFVSAGVTKGLGGAFLPAGGDLPAIAYGTVVSALIGGTTSRLVGGKFANGAQTAAMQYVLNQVGSRWAAKIARKLWTITPHGTKSALKTRDGRKYYQSKVDDTWWSKDTDGHGGSVWKVFEKRGDGLHWLADADEYGDYILNKHKGDVGRFISNKQLSSASIPSQAVTNAVIIGVTILEVIDPLTYLYSGNHQVPPPADR